MNMLRLVAVVANVMLTLATGTPNKILYYYWAAPYPWNEAWEICERSGLTLLKIDSQDVDWALQYFVNRDWKAEWNTGGSFYWTGLHNINTTESQYVWPDCEPLGSYQPWTKTHHPGECVALKGTTDDNLDWGNRPCYTSGYTICEEQAGDCSFIAYTDETVLHGLAVFDLQVSFGPQTAQDCQKQCLGYVGFAECWGVTYEDIPLSPICTLHSAGSFIDLHSRRVYHPLQSTTLYIKFCFKAELKDEVWPFYYNDAELDYLPWKGCSTKAAVPVNKTEVSVRDVDVALVTTVTGVNELSMEPTYIYNIFSATQIVDPLVTSTDTNIGYTEPLVTSTLADTNIGYTEPLVTSTLTDTNIVYTKALVTSTLAHTNIGYTEQLVTSTLADTNIGYTKPLVTSTLADSKIGYTEPLVTSTLADTNIGYSKPLVTSTLADTNIGYSETPTSQRPTDGSAHYTEMYPSKVDDGISYTNSYNEISQNVEYQTSLTDTFALTPSFDVSLYSATQTYYNLPQSVSTGDISGTHTLPMTDPTTTTEAFSSQLITSVEGVSGLTSYVPMPSFPSWEPLEKSTFNDRSWTTESTVVPVSDFRSISSYTDPSGTASRVLECTCCKSDKSKPLESHTITIEKILKELSVDLKNISSYQRKFRSVADGRRSAVTMGCVGIIILCVVFGGLFVSDTLMILRHMYSTPSHLLAAREKIVVIPYPGNNPKTASVHLR